MRTSEVVLQAHDYLNRQGFEVNRDTLRAALKGANVTEVHLAKLREKAVGELNQGQWDFLFKRG